MLDFLKSHKGSLIATASTVAFGTIVMISAVKVGQKEAIAPNAPQSKALAASRSCTLSFPVGRGKQVSPSTTETSHTSEGKDILCIGLSGSPKSVEVGIPVTYYAFGISTTAELTKTSFLFGDGKGEDIAESVPVNTIAKRMVSHAYQKPGSYDTTVFFTDANQRKSFASDYCKVRISVTR